MMARQRPQFPDGWSDFDGNIVTKMMPATKDVTIKREDSERYTHHIKSWFKDANRDHPDDDEVFAELMEIFKV